VAVKKKFLAVCDNCGRQTALVESEKDLLERLSKAHWHVTKSLASDSTLTTCPKCWYTCEFCNENIAAYKSATKRHPGDGFFACLKCAVKIACDSDAEGDPEEWAPLIDELAAAFGPRLFPDWAKETDCGA